ncbi:MAG TPA: protease inhibitor I42 family protein [Nevskia sp.]|nr:protease inhibitor I42 family protein [Nevskia sp.]
MPRHRFRHFARTALAGASLLCAACSPPVLGLKDNGRLVHLHPGNHFKVQLDSNPSTGYSWQVADADPTMVRPGKVTEVPPEHPLPGSPETVVLEFQVLRPGHSALTLAYRQPWATDAPPARTYALDLSVD